MKIGKFLVNFTSQWGSGVLEFIGAGYASDEAFGTVTRGVHVTLLGISLWFAYWREDGLSRTGGGGWIGDPMVPGGRTGWRHAFRGAEGGKVS